MWFLVISLLLMSVSQEKKIEIAKIKAWVRTFAEKHDLWFECHNEPHIPSIYDMEPSYIDGKIFIEINRFYDITVGVFQFIRENIEEEECTSIDMDRFFIVQSSNFVNEADIFATIIREIDEYVKIEPEYISLVEK